MATAWNSSEASFPSRLRQVSPSPTAMARTIPGLRAATPVVRKKPSGSVRIDGPYWSGYTSTAPAPSVLGGALLVFALIMLPGAGTMTTAMLLGCAALNLIGMVAWRSWANHRRARNLRGKNARNVLIVGAGRLGHQVADYLARSYTGQIVKGFLDQNRGADPRILGRIEDLPEVARAEFA